MPCEHQYLVPGGGGEYGALCLHHTLCHTRMWGYTQQQFLDWFSLHLSVEDAQVMEPRDLLLPVGCPHLCPSEQSPHHGPIMASRLSPHQPRWQLLNMTGSATGASMWSPNGQVQINIQVERHVTFCKNRSQGVETRQKKKEAYGLFVHSGIVWLSTTSI